MRAHFDDIIVIIKYLKNHFNVFKKYCNNLFRETHKTNTDSNTNHFLCINVGNKQLTNEFIQQYNVHQKSCKHIYLMFNKHSLKFNLCSFWMEASFRMHGSSTNPAGQSCLPRYPTLRCPESYAILLSKTSVFPQMQTLSYVTLSLHVTSQILWVRSPGNIVFKKERSSSGITYGLKKSSSRLYILVNGSINFIAVGHSVPISFSWLFR